ncbi:MAG: hypothetical protein JW993_21215 [Sedimentisphaerales bacterium]|nr:hypothetical protein [Sedimentisphaerales bacterium]
MSKRMGAGSTVFIVLCVLAAWATGGCISSRSDVTYGSKGPAVGSSTLRKIKVGRTSKEWVLGTLGEPSSETTTPDGTEILMYEYTKRVDSHFEFEPFLDSHDKREERTVYYFEITDGIVTRFWKE